MRVFIIEDEFYPYLSILETRSRIYDYSLDIPEEFIEKYIKTQKEFEKLNKELYELIEKAD